MKKTVLRKFSHKVKCIIPFFDGNLFTVIILLLFCSTNVKAQVNSYSYSGVTTATDPTAAYSTIAAVGTSLFTTVWDDNVSAAIPLGFTFNFKGTNYTSVFISSNGFITFGAAPATTNYNPISGGAVYDGAIAAYGTNMITNTTSVFYLSAGVAGNRIFTVQHSGLRKSGAAGTMNTQIKLYENGFKIEVYHKLQTTVYSNTLNIFGEIGLRGSTNADVNNLNWQPAPVASPGSNWATPLPNNTLAANANYKVRTQGPLTPVTNTLDTKFTWSPVTCYAPAVSVPVVSVLYNAATINWTLPSPAAGIGYDYEIRTNTSPGTGGATVSGSVAAGVTTTGSLTGLLSSTVYYVYVRSHCTTAPDTYSNWSSAVTITTLCYFATVSYTQDFNTSTPPNIPSCNSSQNLVAASYSSPYYQSYWVTSDPTPNVLIPVGVQASDWGFNTKHLRCFVQGGVANNAYYYTQGISLTAGQSYRLAYTYGASAEVISTSQNLKVYYGNAPYVGSMTTLIDTHTAIKGGPYNIVINFVPATDGIYYLGFQDYSAAGNATLLLDNISLTLTSCFGPSAASLISGGVTSSSAIIGWTAPATAPASGYEYYVSPSSSAPNAGTVPTGTSLSTTANLSALTPATPYYFWVRSNCGSGDSSSWTATYGTFTTAAAPVLLTYCGGVNPSSTTVTTYISNFKTTGGISNISNPSVFTAPGYANYTAGSSVSQVIGGSVTAATTMIQTGGVGLAIFVDWNQNGVFDYPSERVAATTAYNFSSPILTATFTVPVGAVVGTTTMRVILDWNSSSPSTPCSITTNSRGEVEDYAFTVLPQPPPIVLSSTSTSICGGATSTPVTITSGGYTTYSWSPNLNVTNTGSGYVFNPATSVVYTITGVNTTTFQSSSTTFTVNVVSPPTAITLSPVSVTSCDVVGQPITATGGNVPGSVIFGENFNGGFPAGWVSDYSLSSGGDPTVSSWQIQNSGYDPGGSSGITSLVSPDSSLFFLSNSDAQGSGTTTYATLTSAAFSLNGVTDASLIFDHYYKGWTPGFAKVEISKDDFATSVVLQNWTNTNTQGTATTFSNSITSLNIAGYINQATPIKIRFTYNAVWGFVWAVDNIKVVGNSSSVTWTPITGLYTTAAGTPGTEYVAGTYAATIYAMPDATTTYTATASSGTGCNTTKTVTVTIPSTTWSSAAGGSWSSGPPDSTMRAIFDYNYSSTGNLAACSVKLKSGVVVFNSNHTLTVQNAINTASAIAGSTFTFEDKASLLQGSTTTANTNTGNITFKRKTTPVTKFDYTYWSSPVTGQALTVVSPLTLSDKYYWFNAAAGVYNWVNVNNLTAMQLGRGYIIRGPQTYTTAAIWEAPFYGVPNNGDVTTLFNLVYTDATRNLNCIGNPYPSAISADLLMSGNPGPLGTGSTLYFWTHNTPISNNAYVFSDYATYNYSGGVGTAWGSGGAGVNVNVPNGFIASGQSFMIKAKSTGTITFKNTMRVAGNNGQFFRTSDGIPPALTPLERSRIWLNIYDSQTAFKQILVGYIENATNGYDDGYDGDVLDAGSAVGFYSLLDDKKLTIQGRQLPLEATDEVPLGYKSTAATTYEIALSQFDGAFTDPAVGVFLEDKLLNVTHDLRQGAYSFVTEVGTFDTRFVLRYNTTLGVHQPDFSENAIIVAVQNNDIKIETSAIAIKEVQIFDIQGRLLCRKENINSPKTIVSNLVAAHQVLLVQIKSMEGKIIYKKIIF